MGFIFWNFKKQEQNCNINRDHQFKNDRWKSLKYFRNGPMVTYTKVTALCFMQKSNLVCQTVLKI